MVAFSKQKCPFKRQSKRNNMNNFSLFNISKQLIYGLDEMGFTEPTPIQTEAYPVILSGKNVVGISQTGTGKTLAYLLPLLNELKYSEERNPRILILVPTRELVTQVMEQIAQVTKYKTVRVTGVFGGTNIKTQAAECLKGMDILVATPGRLYDLVLGGVVALKGIKKLVIDEVDVMLDLGFLFQLNNLFELLPDRRQNIMFSATMTDEVDALIKDFFYQPVQISTAVSGTPLDNISQVCYQAPNFYTKSNLLRFLLKDDFEFSKVLIFVPGKRIADRLFEELQKDFWQEIGVIHANRSQNNRFTAIEEFNNGNHRILIATDVIARGMDLEKISHVINFDTPVFPENYMHRIGRTGRAESLGNTILLYSEKEIEAKEAIEALMNYKIPQIELPEEVDISRELIPEEKTKPAEITGGGSKSVNTGGAAFHEKSAKNSKENLGSRYKREIKTKFKKPLTRGDKNQNKKR